MRYASPTSKRYLWHLQQVRRRKRARREPDIDADAAAYIAAVEAEDGEALEPAIVAAYDQFVRGCKADGIWNAIKASCIMAGARTLSGALVPLVGPAPTNFNFVSGDYNRVTGLKGDGSTKRLNSNRLDNSDPQNNAHTSIFVSSPSDQTSTSAYVGGGSGGNPASFRGFQRVLAGGVIGVVPYNRNAAAVSAISGINDVGFFGNSRSDAVSFLGRANQTTISITAASNTLVAQNIQIFARNLSGTIGLHSNARLSFYSIGEAIDLEALDTRVTALMDAIDEALS